jgi:hypothetical protein
MADPLTPDELRHVRNIVLAEMLMPPSLPRRLLATVEALTARLDKARELATEVRQLQRRGQITAADRVDDLIDLLTEDDTDYPTTRTWCGHGHQENI